MVWVRSQRDESPFGLKLLRECRRGHFSSIQPNGGRYHDGDTGYAYRKTSRIRIDPVFTDLAYNRKFWWRILHDYKANYYDLRLSDVIWLSIIQQAL